jgi:hypothetical protein
MQDETNVSEGEHTCALDTTIRPWVAKSADALEAYSLLIKDGSACLVGKRSSTKHNEANKCDMRPFVFVFEGYVTDEGIISEPNEAGFETRVKLRCGDWHACISCLRECNTLMKCIL